jgi:hypothetical protein
MAEDDPWLSLTEAAQQSGLARETIRGRARRGQITSRKGNRGELLVQLPAEMLTWAGPAGTAPLADLVADLTAEVAELRERLARAEAAVDTAKAVAEARADAAKDAADARVTAARVEAKAVRELADRLTAELADLRRPWWRRWCG